jgi:hypothetical protein
MIAARGVLGCAQHAGGDLGALVVAQADDPRAGGNAPAAAGMAKTVRMSAATSDPSSMSLASA